MEDLLKSTNIIGIEIINIITGIWAILPTIAVVALEIKPNIKIKTIGNTKLINTVAGEVRKETFISFHIGDTFFLIQEFFLNNQIKRM